MKKEMELVYDDPRVKLILVAVEQGFNLSMGDDSPEGDEDI